MKQRVFVENFEKFENFVENSRMRRIQKVITLGERNKLPIKFNFFNRARKNSKWLHKLHPRSNSNQINIIVVEIFNPPVDDYFTKLQTNLANYFPSSTSLYFYSGDFRDDERLRETPQCPVLCQRHGLGQWRYKGQGSYSLKVAD